MAQNKKAKELHIRKLRERASQLRQFAAELDKLATQFEQEDKEYAPGGIPEIVPV